MVFINLNGKTKLPKFHVHFTGAYRISIAMFNWAHDFVTIGSERRHTSLAGGVNNAHPHQMGGTCRHLAGIKKCDIRLIFVVVVPTDALIGDVLAGFGIYRGVHGDGHPLVSHGVSHHEGGPKPGVEGNLEVGHGALLSVEMCGV